MAGLCEDTLRLKSLMSKEEDWLHEFLAEGEGRHTGRAIPIALELQVEPDADYYELALFQRTYSVWHSLLCGNATDDERARHRAEFDRIGTKEIIQGGVSAGARGALQKRLAACNYRKDSKDWRVHLFGNTHGVFDGSVFGAPKSSDMHDFDGTNIHCIHLPDPGRGENAWGRKRLGTFYNMVDCVKSEKLNGYKTVVACVAGKNRSVAVKYAIEPECNLKPECEAMCRAVEGYHNDRDMSLAPLAPKPSKRSRGQ